MAFVTPRIIKESSSGFSAYAIQDEMFEQREVFCVGNIDAEHVNSLIAQLLYLERTDSKAEITMYFNSPGGEVASGLALYDVMQGISSPIRTVCVGAAASMAAVLFIAGDQREMMPHGKIMIHDPLLANFGGSAIKIKDTADEIMKTRNDIAKIIAKHSGLSLRNVLKKTAKDSYFSAKDSVKFGLADAVITTMSHSQQSNN